MKNQKRRLIFLCILFVIFILTHLFSVKHIASVTDLNSSGQPSDNTVLKDIKKKTEIKGKK